MNEATSTDYGPDQAFAQASAGNDLFGGPLRKFSPSRKEAADRMGWVHPCLVADKWAVFRQTGIYPGMQADVRTVLWLCTIRDRSEVTPEEYRAGNFDPDRAFNFPDEARDVSRSWAAEQKIDDVMTEEFSKAYERYLQIILGIEASAFQVKPEETSQPRRETSDPKTKPGHRKARSSSRKSRG